MIKFDDSLLSELNLAGLPEEEGKRLLKQIYETLELRVGKKLAEQMSEPQLDEFEMLMVPDNGFAEQYLNRVKPGWQQSEEFVNSLRHTRAVFEQKGLPFNENSVKIEFGAVTWLGVNFPNYKQVVSSQLNILKEEIKRDSAQISQAVGHQSGRTLSEQPAMQSPLQSNPSPSPGLSPQQTQGIPGQPIAPSNPRESYQVPQQPPAQNTTQQPPANLVQ